MIKWISEIFFNLWKVNWVEVRQRKMSLRFEVRNKINFSVVTDQLFNFELVL